MASKLTSTRNLAAIMTVGAALSVASAAQAEQTCDSRLAREILQTEDYDSMCSCEFVTTKFIGTLQSHKDFQRILGSVTDACSGFVGPLTSITTASIDEPRFPGPRGNDNPPDDPPDDPPNGPPSDPPSDPPDDPPTTDDEPPFNGGTPFDRLR